MTITIAEKTTKRGAVAEPSAGLSLVDQIYTDGVERRRAAAVRYRELLLRNDSPEPGDAAELVAVMATLGRSDTDLKADLQLMTDLEGSEVAIARARELEQPLKDARAKTHALRHEFEAAQKALAAKWEERIGAARKLEAGVFGELSVQRELANRLPTLQKRWRALAEGLAPEQVDALRRVEKLDIPSGSASREATLAECRRRVAAKAIPPSMSSADWVDRQLARAGFATLSADERKAFLRGTSRYTRQQIIAAARHQFVEQRMVPVVGGVSVESIRRTLDRAFIAEGQPPISEREARELDQEIEGWIAELHSRQPRRQSGRDPAGPMPADKGDSQAADKPDADKPDADGPTDAKVNQSAKSKSKSAS